MVVRANSIEHSIGGHISTYASAATLYEVGFNHFFRARTESSRATRSISRDTLRREFMPVRFLKGASPRSSLKTSGGN